MIRAGLAKKRVHHLFVMRVFAVTQLIVSGYCLSPDDPLAHLVRVLPHRVDAGCEIAPRDL